MLIPIVFMTIASAALLAAIGFLWSSFRSAFGTADAFNLPDASADSRRSLEERKTALLTNINDLEFDHQAGKVSDEDFKSLHTKLRTEAKRVLRLLDEDVKPFRAQAEALVRSRMESLGTPYRDPLGKRDEDPPQEGPVEAEAKSEKPDAPVANDCAECGTINDSDAVFCKKCGSTLAEQKADGAEKSEGAKSAGAKTADVKNAEAEAEAEAESAGTDRAAEDGQ